MSDRESQQHNILPEELKNHHYAQKYQYVDYDEELGIPVRSPGFYVDIFTKPFISPFFFNKTCDPFEEMKSRTMEKGDFLLCCPQKTGQHWVWEIMSMLKAGSSNYMRAEKDSSWVDIEPLDDIYKRYNCPRVLCTHLALGWIPQSFRRADTKVVVTLRNLKDAFTSQFFHTQLFNEQDDSMTWPIMFRKLMSSQYCTYGSYFDFYADTWDNYRDDPNVLLVFYEDLKRSPAQMIEKIAKHMEVEYTPELISKIAGAVDISKMKAAKDAIVQNKGSTEPSAYRKGQIGDWKNLFTVAQNEEFDKVMAEWNKERQMPFVYE